MATLTQEESRIIGVLRAINAFEDSSLVDSTDVGHIAEGLKAIYDLSVEEENLSAKELQALLRGFVGGIAATRLSRQAPQYDEIFDLPEGQAYSGGPTGGVIEGQGENPAYVVQSGVHDG